MNFGEKLKILRTDKHLTQKQVAEKLGMSVRAYSAYELNKSRPRTQSKLQQIADFFGTSADFLLIDDLEEKYGLLEDNSIIMEKKLEYWDTIFDKIIPFLKNLGWTIHTPQNSNSSRIATLNSIRIVFEITSPQPALTALYGCLCILPPEDYTQTYCVIIAENDEIDEYVKNLPPHYLSIPVCAFSYHSDTNEFQSPEIFKFISKLSQ